MPWVGAISTVPDLFRFAEMLRRGGTLDGARIVSPAMLKLATRNWTGDLPNELYKGIAINHGWEPYPAYLGLGFGLAGERVCPNLLGTLTSPGTFGNYGAGSTLFERMANLSRGGPRDEAEDEEEEGEEEDDGASLNIPRFLGRQNNQ